MAEGFEENVQFLNETLSMCYVDLRDAYEALPLPILLPRAEQITGIAQVQDAIVEASEMIAFLPVRPAAGQALLQASLHWVSASALILEHRISRRTSCYKTAVWNLHEADGLTDTAKALLRQD
jgi:hypothetical protein